MTHDNDNAEFVPPTPSSIGGDISAELTALDSTWSTTKAADGFTMVEPGKYQAYVDKAYVTRGKLPPHNLLLKMELVIFTGPNQGKRLFRNNGLSTPENIAWAKKDLATCGIDLAKASDLPMACEQLKYLGLNVTVVNKPPQLGQDRPTQNVYIDGTFGRVQVEQPGEPSPT